MKLKENSGSDLDAEPSSDSYQSELQLLASKLSPKGRILQEQQSNSNICCYQTGGPYRGRAKPRNYGNQGLQCERSVSFYGLWYHQLPKELLGSAKMDRESQ